MTALLSPIDAALSIVAGMPAAPPLDVTAAILRVDRAHIAAWLADSPEPEPTREQVETLAQDLRAAHIAIDLSWDDATEVTRAQWRETARRVLRREAAARREERARIAHALGSGETMAPELPSLYDVQSFEGAARVALRHLVSAIDAEPNDRAAALTHVDTAEQWIEKARGFIDGHCRVCRGDARSLEWSGGEAHTCGGGDVVAAVKAANARPLIPVPLTGSAHPETDAAADRAADMGPTAGARARLCPSRWYVNECALPVGHVGQHATEGRFAMWSDAAATNTTIEAKP